METRICIVRDPSQDLKYEIVTEQENACYDMNSPERVQPVTKMHGRLKGKVSYRTDKSLSAFCSPKNWSLREEKVSEWESLDGTHTVIVCIKEQISSPDELGWQCARKGLDLQDPLYNLRLALTKRHNGRVCSAAHYKPGQILCGNGPYTRCRGEAQCDARYTSLLYRACQPNVERRQYSLLKEIVQVLNNNSVALHIEGRRSDPSAIVERRLIIQGVSIFADPIRWNMAGVTY